MDASTKYHPWRYMELLWHAPTQRLIRFAGFTDKTNTQVKLAGVNSMGILDEVLPSSELSRPPSKVGSTTCLNLPQDYLKACDEARELMREYKRTCKKNIR